MINATASSEAVSVSMRNVRIRRFAISNPRVSIWYPVRDNMAINLRGRIERENFLRRSEPHDLHAGDLLDGRFLIAQAVGSLLARPIQHALFAACGVDMPAEENRRMTQPALPVDVHE